MSEPASYIVSDLHLGNTYFHRDAFLAWLDSLPDGARLVLNGDTIDDPREPLPEEHQQVLARLVAESARRPVVWVYGNHDEGLELEETGQVEFVERWELGRRLMALHGDELDAVMPRHGLFRATFKLIHKMRIAFGFPDVHVAYYAKKWAYLYRVLNQHVARKAVRAARALGFEAVTCGHTHAAMDIELEGRRYLNTGAWTEAPHHYVRADDEGIELCTVSEG